mgnify:CR=1 FL=1
MTAMSPVAAPVAATRTPARPRRPLANLPRIGKEDSAAAVQLHRILPGDGDQGLEVAAFGSSI